MTILDSLAQKIQSTSRAPVIANPTKYSRRNQNITAPVNEVKLSYYEEQRLYDRMYEAEVYKNGKFFGYRSTTNERWHTDENNLIRAEQQVELTDLVKYILAERAKQLWSSNRYKLEPTYLEILAARKDEIRAARELKDREAYRETLGPVMHEPSSFFWPEWTNGNKSLSGSTEIKTNERIRQRG